MRRRLLGLVIGAAIVLTPGLALASASFPQAIDDYLGARCRQPPPCTICHNSLNGGQMTISTRFGKTMQGFGLTLESTPTLKHALDQEKAQHIDSDGDGDTDIDALIACKDPNVANSPPSTGDAGGDAGGLPSSAPPSAFADPVPEYGCALGRAPRADGVWAAMAAGAVFALRRRRFRAHRK